MKVYKYIRYSTNEQDEASQDNIIYEYCVRKGITPNETFRDEGVSGGKKYTQRNLGELCKKLKKGDCVVVSEVSRLTRGGIGELCEIIETYFKPNKLRLIICNVGIDIDCSCLDAMTELTLYIFAAVAKMEKEMICQRTKSSMDSIKREIAEFGYHISKSGNKITSLGGGEPSESCHNAAGRKSRQRALENDNNMKFYRYFLAFEERNGKFETNDRETNAKNWELLAHELNQLGYKTSRGLEFTSMRCRNTYRTLKETLKGVKI